MRKHKYDPPTSKFPYKISKRLNLMSTPRQYIIQSDEGMPAFTPRGIRVSAIKGQATDRVADAAWPYIRRFVIIKRMYKNKFSEERLERIDRMMEAANVTCYSKLAKCMLDLKKVDVKDPKKKKGWTESEWKKHMDYIGQIAAPKKDHMPPDVRSGPKMPIEDLLKRINHLAKLPNFKVYKRLSKEDWYRDPIKVPPNALKYVISDRVKKLAVPKVIPQFTSFD